ncbi:hypothetical protein PENNAL_c0685G08172, partial [Penicillium nalgiovense]
KAKSEAYLFTVRPVDRKPGNKEPGPPTYSDPGI